MLGQRVHQVEQVGNAPERGLDHLRPLPQPLDRAFGQQACFVAGFGDLALVRFELGDGALQRAMFGPQFFRRLDHRLDDPGHVGTPDGHFAAAFRYQVDRSRKNVAESVMLH